MTVHKGPLDDIKLHRQPEDIGQAVFRRYTREAIYTDEYLYNEEFYCEEPIGKKLSAAENAALASYCIKQMRYAELADNITAGVFFSELIERIS